jgi:hypothetical protein
LASQEPKKTDVRPSQAPEQIDSAFTPTMVFGAVQIARARHETRDIACDGDYRTEYDNASTVCANCQINPRFLRLRWYKLRIALM